MKLQQGEDVMRFGLIGAGFIGTVHANRILSEPRATLTWVFDVDQGAAHKIAGLTGANIATSIDEILSDKEVDAVIIASSTDSHGVIARSAIAHGKSFLCEKPLDRTLQAAQETAEMTLSAGVFGGLAFNRRFDRQHSMLRDSVVRGDIGTIEMMHLTSRSQSPPEIAYAMNSGGLLRDKGAHFFDLACWIAQDHPVQVYAQGDCLFEPRLAEIGDLDTAMIILKFSRGALCHFDFSRRTAYGYDERIEVFGSKGRIVSGTPLPLEVVSYLGDTITRAGLHQTWFERVEPTYKAQLLAFIDALEDGGKSFPNVKDGLLAEKIAEAAQKSVNTGNAIHM
jgi:myo-inositol 2-dehydrogenase/D-chiro-inositol 1-dehydrogenase